MSLNVGDRVAVIDESWREINPFWITDWMGLGVTFGQVGQIIPQIPLWTIITDDEQGEPTPIGVDLPFEPTPVYRYYAITEPPYDDSRPTVGALRFRIWVPCRELTLGNKEAAYWGWVEYIQPLSFEAAWKYNLLPEDEGERTAFWVWYLFDRDAAIAGTELAKFAELMAREDKPACYRPNDLQRLIVEAEDHGYSQEWLIERIKERTDG